MKAVYTLEDLRDWRRVTAGEQPPLRLAILGDPVEHSASPPMQNAALIAAGIDARYCRLHVRAAEFSEALRLLPQLGFLGANCTIPHKTAALAAVHSTDENARRAGGVNTIVFSPDLRARGYSTDGAGFELAVREQLGVDLATRRVLVLGAGGGAGRAVAAQCASAKARGLILMNRDTGKLSALYEAIAAFYPSERLAIAPWNDAALIHALADSDLVVNCSPLGMKTTDASPIAAELLTSRHAVFDTIYTAHRTPLMLAADAAGARSANGLAMLLHQGALAFEHWFSRPAPLAEMRAALE